MKEMTAISVLLMAVSLLLKVIGEDSAGAIVLNRYLGFLVLFFCFATGSWVMVLIGCLAVMLINGIHPLFGMLSFGAFVIINMFFI